MSRNRKKMPKGGNNYGKDRANTKQSGSSEKRAGTSGRKDGGTSREERSADKSSADQASVSKEEDNSSQPSALSRAGVRGSPSNDPEWYSADVRLLIDSASLPFANPLGDILKLKESTGTIMTAVADQNIRLDVSNSMEERAYPGITTQWIVPSLGGCVNRNDPANVCATAFYTHVRYMNSGRKNYEQADLMIYALTIAELYSFIGYCQRLYQYAFMYSQRNKYIAKALIEACGANATDLLSNLANFRYWLNAFINKVSSYVIPSDINLFKRKAFMYTGLYIENNDGNIKDQLYQFAPAAFYIFALDAQGKGMLQLKDFHWQKSGTTLPRTVASIMEFGNDMLAPITADEDFGLISGDILKAYQGNIVGISQIAEDAGIIPTYDPWVLSQMHNATIFNEDVIGINASGSNYKLSFGTEEMAKLPGNIYQLDNGDLCQIMWVSANGDSISLGEAYSALAINTGAIVDLENPQPTPPEIMEATRLKVVRWENPPELNVRNSGVQAPASSLALIRSGTEIVQCETVYTMADNGAAWVETKFFSNMLGYNIYFNQIADNFAFRYNAIKLLAEITGSTTAVLSVDRLWVASNLANYTIADTHALQKMHETALLSLFYVPGVAKMIN